MGFLVALPLLHGATVLVALSLLHGAAFLVALSLLYGAAVLVAFPLLNGATFLVALSLLHGAAFLVALSFRRLYVEREHMDLRGEWAASQAWLLPTGIDCILLLRHHGGQEDRFNQDRRRFKTPLLAEHTLLARGSIACLAQCRCRVTSQADSGLEAIFGVCLLSSDSAPKAPREPGRCGAKHRVARRRPQ